METNPTGCQTKAIYFLLKFQITNQYIYLVSFLICDFDMKNLRLNINAKKKKHCFVTKTISIEPSTDVQHLTPCLTTFFQLSLNRSLCLISMSLGLDDKKVV